MSDPDWFPSAKSERRLALYFVLAAGMLVACPLAIGLLLWAAQQ